MELLGCYNILVWFMQVEEQTHNRCTELMAMEYVDLYSCSSNHHGCIQHRVKVPMQDRKLNKDNHTCPMASSEDDTET